MKDARPVVDRDFADLVALAKQDGWPGYFGTPAIATKAAGERAMNAIAQAAVDAALKILDGAKCVDNRRAGRIAQCLTS